MNTTDKIIAYYLEGNSIAACSRKFKISAYLIKKELKNNNIKLRSRSEQLILENIRRSKKINHNYFDVLNLENSYYLGFIAADGTIRKDRNEIKIGLSAIDKEFLLEFKNNIQSECKLREYTTSNGFDIVSLTFNSANIKSKLGEFSIVPNKTYLGITMENIPDEYKLSFIKGYFDGDGSFSFNRKTKQCSVKIISHTKEILEEINAFFNNSGYIYKRTSNNYSLEFSTIPSLKIMQKFYELNTPYLHRKKTKYLEALQLRK